jgi:hypothetical protein
MFRHTIQHAEATVGVVQDALDETQRVLHFAERAQDTVRRHSRLIRMLGIAVVLGGFLAFLGSVAGLIAWMIRRFQRRDSAKGSTVPEPAPRSEDETTVAVQPES